MLFGAISGALRRTGRAMPQAARKHHCTVFGNDHVEIIIARGMIVPCMAPPFPHSSGDACHLECRWTVLRECKPSSRVIDLR
eukprot:scaffold279656_cov30-Tisochrysis_lutea.AAC.2